MRGSFGRLSRAWSLLLTDAQRNAWNVADPKVQSAKRLGKSGPLTGQQHYSETHEIVPAKPADSQAAAARALPLPPHMHKGCTRGAQGTVAPPLPGSQANGKPVMPGGEASAAGLGGGVEVGADDGWP